MEIRIFQVDVFSDGVFSGNPAAVCPLDKWLPDDLMQSIAQENNLSETAFFVSDEDPMTIRWFTPATEVELCGHATLAAAHVLRTKLGYTAPSITFGSHSGTLGVSCSGTDAYTLDFPVDTITKEEEPLDAFSAFNQRILEAWRGKTDTLLRLESQQAVEQCRVEFEALHNFERRGFLITAKGTDCDYVARCFFPRAGINEDPATGSSHTTLTPYWAREENKTSFTAQQLSARKGFFRTALTGDRVLITGRAVSYLEGIVRI